MTSRFSQEELVQYLYNETSEARTLEIESALQTDWNLQEELETLRSALSFLPLELESPRPQVIKRILEYARETSSEAVQH